MKTTFRSTGRVLSLGSAWVLGVLSSLILESQPAFAQAIPPAPTPPAAPRAGGAPGMPGEAGPLPTSMDKIATATDIDYKPLPGGARVKFNLQEADLAELVNHISGMTGRRFIYGAKVRSIKATVVSPEPITLDEAYQAFLSILEVNGMTVVPHGRFLKIVDSAGVAGQTTPIVERGAPLPNTDSFVTRLYRTRYVSADDAAALLGKFKSKDGDISTYSGGNLLIMTDTGAQIRRMVRILEEIDVGGAGQQMWIEPVNHGSASEMATRINDLFDVGQGNNGGLAKVVADEQTNSVIIVGTEDSYTKLLGVMRKLDNKPGEGGRAHVLRLQHAVADELAKTLQMMLSGRGGTVRQGGGGANGSSGQSPVTDMFEGDVTVTPDQATNSLLIASSARDFAQLRVLIDQLDRARRQIFIEAVIMDVTVNDTNKLGVSWHGGAQPNLGGSGTSTMLGGFNAGNSVAFPGDTSSLQGFAAGIRGPDLDGTTNLLGTGLAIPAFGVVVNAIASSGRGNVLSSPHIIATDNVQAQINVGENIPLQTNAMSGLSSLASTAAAGSTAGTSALGALGGLGMSFQNQRQDVGNKINVTPHINESDQVRLEIEQESSAAGTPVGSLGAVPITKRTAKTTVVVKDQQTIVIGGLMADSYVTSKDRVPILGDIPILGVLFSSTKQETKKSNLLLILTPHVIREQADLRRIFERKMQERQEFIDRYFVFATDSWEPPTDYTRTNGLVEDIRQAYFEIEESARLEAEYRPKEMHDHVPGDPIDLPSNVKAGSGGKGGKSGGSQPSSPQRSPAPTPNGPTGQLNRNLQLESAPRSVFGPSSEAMQ